MARGSTVAVEGAVPASAQPGVGMPAAVKELSAELLPSVREISQGMAKLEPVTRDDFIGSPALTAHIATRASGWTGSESASSLSTLSDGAK
jgi:hypothetical protein